MPLEIRLIALPQYVITTTMLEWTEGVAKLNTAIQVIRESIEESDWQFAGFLLGFLGRGGKCKVGSEEVGHASRACVAPRGGLGFQMLRDRISCHLN